MSGIRQIRPLTITRPVPVDSRSEVFFAVDDKAHEWVTKEVAGYYLVAEAMGWLVARDLRVRQPDAAIFFKGDKTWWATKKVHNAAAWDQSLASRISERLHRAARLVRRDPATVRAEGALVQ